MSLTVNKSKAIKVTLSLVGLLIFISYLVGTNAPNYKAYEECEKQIKKVLKDPETAKVVSIQESWMVWKTTQKTHSVQANVRASNSFGAFITQTMTCYFDEQGDFLYVR